ncbi:MAG: 23S rRNA (pseudouridine(1915)-N(3))-methyltransferase RlmH [Myxococcota bacterium]
MLRIHIAAVGKVKERGLRTAVDDYKKRIQRYARCDEHELKDAPTPELTERFRRLIPERSRTVALEVEGKRWSSERLARFVGDAEGGSVSHLVFLIGGSYGLPAPVRALADEELSLSALTLPHRLARLVLAEQIYRAFTILRNEPYSH